eukprot:2846857-Amphidinium_carterae.2
MLLLARMSECDGHRVSSSQHLHYQASAVSWGLRPWQLYNASHHTLVDVWPLGWRDNERSHPCCAPPRVNTSDARLATFSSCYDVGVPLLSPSSRLVPTPLSSIKICI